MDNAHGSEISSKTKIFTYVVTGLSILIGYIVLNGILYGIQWTYGNAKLNKFNNLNSQLATEGDSLKSQSASLDALSSQLDDLKARLDSAEKAGNAYAYNSMVEPYNTLLTQYKTGEADYNNRAKTYNALIEQTNEAGKQVPKRIWLIIPIPNLSHHTFK